jgi:ribonuclease HI
VIVEIYTDGACSGNPGPGGWAAVLRFGGEEREISGGCSLTTNNRAELQACIEALKLLKRPCQVIVYSDSAYLVNAFKDDWIATWYKREWRNSKDDHIKNKDLWLELLALVGHPNFGKGRHRVEFRHVAGHAGIALNERCDALACAERDIYKRQAAS